MSVSSFFFIFILQTKFDKITIEKCKVIIVINRCTLILNIIKLYKVAIL